MTKLTIVPNIDKKAAKCIGTIAAGEVVEVTVKGFADKISGLGLRVMATGERNLAIFPMPESEDAWSVSGEDAVCELNLNTVQAMRLCRGEIGVVFVLENREAKTLYAIGEYYLKAWPRDRTSDGIIDLDDYKSQIEQLTIDVRQLGERLNAAEDKVEDANNRSIDAKRIASESKEESSAAKSEAVTAKNEANVAKVAAIQAKADADRAALEAVGAGEQAEVAKQSAQAAQASAQSASEKAGAAAESAANAISVANSKLSADDVVPKLSEGTEIAVIGGKSIKAPSVMEGALTSDDVVPETITNGVKIATIGGKEIKAPQGGGSGVGLTPEQEAKIAEIDNKVSSVKDAFSERYIYHYKSKDSKYEIILNVDFTDTLPRIWKFVDVIVFRDGMKHRYFDREMLKDGLVGSQFDVVLKDGYVDNELMILLGSGLDRKETYTPSNDFGDFMFSTADNEYLFAILSYGDDANFDASVKGDLFEKNTGKTTFVDNLRAQSSRDVIRRIVEGSGSITFETGVNDAVQSKAVLNAYGLTVTRDLTIVEYQLDNSNGVNVFNFKIIAGAEKFTYIVNRQLVGDDDVIFSREASGVIEVMVANNLVFVFDPNYIADEDYGIVVYDQETFERWFGAEGAMVLGRTYGEVENIEYTSKEESESIVNDGFASLLDALN